MSKESYARGFCKAAEAAGVDPVALAKFAGEAGPETDAGIGSREDNSSEIDYSKGKVVPWDRTSYIGKLLARHPGTGKGVGIPYVPHSAEGWPEAQRRALVSLGDLENGRRDQAGYNAQNFFPRKSALYKRIVDNLINAGKENYKSYIETGDPKERTEPNLQGIEKIKLTPEQKKMLLQMQNTMARNGAPRQMNIA